MLTGIDHLVILVPQLDVAMRHYTDLGFTVQAGGVHPGGTHNALIAFADGAYIELIAFQEPDAPSNHRWHAYLASGGGLVDFALGTTDLAADIARVGGVGVRYTPQDGGRARPDGVTIQWRNGTPEPTGSLPFMIEDVTPRNLRVATGAATHHANGVTGVLSVTFATNDLQTAARRFGILLDTDGITETQNDALRAYSVTFLVGQYAIELVQPMDDVGPLAAQLAARGDGPYSACLTVNAPDAPILHLDPALTGGARLDFAPVKGGDA